MTSFVVLSLLTVSISVILYIPIPPPPPDPGSPWEFALPLPGPMPVPSAALVCLLGSVPVPSVEEWRTYFEGPDRLVVHVSCLNRALSAGALTANIVTSCVSVQRWIHVSLLEHSRLIPRFYI